MSFKNHFLPGQVVVLLKGVGLPAVEAITTEAILTRVEVKFAVTAAGRLLTEADLDGIIPTDTILDPGQYRISATAVEIHTALKRGIDQPCVEDFIQELA